MRSPHNLKEVQKLTGMLASLSHFFFTKNGRKSKAFLQVLKKRKHFQSSEQCEKMFFKFKTFLATPPIPTRSTPEAEFLFYLYVSNSTISLALLQEDGKK